MNHPSDERIDRTLNALRDTQAPAGLQARVAARLAQAAEANPAPAPFFAGVLNAVKISRIPLADAPLYATAATALALLLAISLASLRHAHPAQTLADTSPIPASTGRALVSPPAVRGSVDTIAERAQTPTREPVTRSIPPSNQLSEAASTLPVDPDTLALAETLAPSRSAPTMPLTPQEQLLANATRQGQPIELAELDALRQPALRAVAEARERSTVRRYVESLLGPLAAAESLNPTPSASSSDIHPDPPSSK